MITEYLLKRIEATLASETSGLLVHVGIMANLHIDVKISQLKKQ